MNKPLSTTPPRLASLDILRGFDLFLLVFFQPVLWALAHQLNAPWLNSILSQFDHEVWEGLLLGSGDAPFPLHDRSFHALLFLEV